MAPVQAGRRTTLTEDAYETIKGRILCLQLAPGMAFTEAQLAEDLHLSRMPVREALGRLQREGLVNLCVRSHCCVARITLKDVRDLFCVRMLLEGTAASLAAGLVADLADLRELEEVSQLGYDPQHGTSISHFLRANTQLHAAIRCGDPEEARAVAVAHIRDSQTMVIESLLSSESLLCTNVSVAPRRPRPALVAQDASR